MGKELKTCLGNVQWIPVDAVTIRGNDVKFILQYKKKKLVNEQNGLIAIFSYNFSSNNIGKKKKKIHRKQKNRISIGTNLPLHFAFYNSKYCS